VVSFSRVEIPYAFKLLEQELNTYLNMGMRVLTDKDVKIFRAPPISELSVDQETALLNAPLPERVLPETAIPEFIPPPEEPEVRPEDLAALGAAEDKEAIAPAPAPAEVPVPAPADSNQGVVLQLGNMNIGMPPPQANAMAPPPPVVPSLEDDATDDMPFAVEQPQMQQQQQQQGVNVQTTNQPVLVVPLSMNQGPARTEMIPPPAPGAPSTLAVDTSANAMRGIAPAAAPNAQRPRNNRSASPGAGAPANVTVNKLGGNSAPPPGANVRVSVNKLG
jgi:hypothetical protein